MATKAKARASANKIAAASLESCQDALNDLQEAIGGDEITLSELPPESLADIGVRVGILYLALRQYDDATRAAKAIK